VLGTNEWRDLLVSTLKAPSAAATLLLPNFDGEVSSARTLPPTARLQVMKVDAGSGRGYASDYGSFGDGIVGTISDIHSLMVDEASYVT
jgi:hypothetical protein